MPTGTITLPAVGHLGYCATTEYNSGECDVDNKGSFKWPIGRRHAGSDLSDHERDIGGMQDCMQKCLLCARCDLVSFSRSERDCSWYRSCDLEHLLDEFATGHHSQRVRFNGSVTAEAKAFMATPVRSPGAAGAAARASAGGATRRRLVDIVTYGGPHYDQLLELRMVELSELVDVFLILEHSRPAAKHASPSARGLDLTQARFAPFANRTRHLRLSNMAGRVTPPSCMRADGTPADECEPIDEFLDGTSAWPPERTRPVHMRLHTDLDPGAAASPRS